ncbi:MAG TPA: tetratricopeptide repeat protein [Candidatus Saccharimonadales bacterium]|nr:tetratricopeptide repeat protein [Candidatus Saccharimonadales bacterium]
MPQTAQELEKLAGDHRNNGEGLKAVEYYKQAADTYLQEGNRQQAAGCWHMVGVSYKVENDIDAAIENLHKAADLNREIGNEIGVGRIYRDIGIAYAYRKEHEEAIKWLRKSVEALEGTGEDAELGISEAKVGLHYLEVHDYNQAEEWLNKGLATIRRTFHWFYEMTALLHLAALRFAQDRPSDAVTNLWAGVGLIFQAGEQEGQKRRLAQLYGLLGQAYLGLGNTAGGVEFFAKAIQLLEPMADNVAKVVYEDIRATDFVRKLREKSSQDAKDLESKLDLSRLK